VVVPWTACTKDPRVTTRTVTLHAPCAAGAALPPTALAVYDALGDFEPASSPPGGHPAGDVGDELPEIPAAARALFVDATASDRHWWGLGAVADANAVDVLMTPALTSCAWPPLAPDAAAVDRTGAVLGPMGDGSVLVVGGGTSKPSTRIVHLDTGVLATARPDLGTPRLRASVTAFGGGGLVAGGVNPSSPSAALDEAEVYDPALGGFDQQNPIRLSEPRADQGAVVLADGATLLVGGTPGDTSAVLASMEIVDPSTRTVRAENVATLAVARRSPAALRLASGEVLVAGGVDASGAGVTTLEWFAADASAPTKRTRDLVAGSARAYIALSGGGALAVIAPPAGAPADFDNTWVIDGEGALEAATPIAGALTRPVLFGSAGGAPVLWTGDRWLRWQPWSGAFVALGALDATPPDLSASTATGDPGLAMWLDGTTWNVSALRFDTRGRYSTLGGPLLVTDTSNLAPDPLATTGAAAFDPSAGDLALDLGASAFVTDRDYADVRVDVDIAGGTILVLRDPSGAELEVGGASCPAPVADGAATLEVVRTGVNVAWSLSHVTAANATAGTCSTSLAANARIAIGVRGGSSAAPSTARNLRVTRLGRP
jgi:hypothetical protein